MIEGCPPFQSKQEEDVPKVYAAKERPPFRAPPKRYAHGLKEYVSCVSLVIFAVFFFSHFLFSSI